MERPLIMDSIIKLLNTQLPEKNFLSSDDYVNDGLLDSFDIISLIVELEKIYDILIDPLDIIPENFSNSVAILNLVKKSGAYVK
jgi:acyl carrier protein